MTGPTGGELMSGTMGWRPARVSGLVSVIIPSYNKACFVIETLNSLSAQTYTNLEVVVIDDASTDESVELIREWMESSPLSTFLSVHKQNQGVSKTLNDGALIARGEFICALAADDVYLPHKIARHVESLRDNPDCSFVYGDARIVDEEGGVIRESMQTGPGAVQFPSGQIFSDLLDRGNFIPAPTVTMRGSALDAVGGYDESLKFEDYDMWLRLSRIGSVAFSGTVDALYRDAQDSLSKCLGEALEVGLLTVWAKYRDEADVDQRQLARHARAYAIRLGAIRARGAGPVTRTREIVNAARLFGGSGFAAITVADYLRVRSRQFVRKSIDVLDPKRASHQ